MALLDMIMESMVDNPDQSFMEMHERESMAEDKSAMESFGGLGDLPEEPASESTASNVVMRASDILAAMEAHADIHRILEPEDKCAADLIHAALEEGLPTENAPYDPSAELDDIAETLAGIDADDGVDPDQPQPDEDMANDMTVENLATEPQDKAPESGSEA